MDLVPNTLGRLVPREVNGFSHEPYAGAWQPLPEAAVRPSPARAPARGRSKVVDSLDAVIEACLPDGGWLSMPHYYRNDPTALRLVLESLERVGRRGVKLLVAAFFDAHAELLLPAIERGVIGGFEGNAYGRTAAALRDGRMLPWVGLGRTHGGRARCHNRGERPVDLAIGPVPVCDAWGNASGILGREGARCGPIGLFEPDACNARHVALLTERVHPGVLAPASIDMRMVDFVVPVDHVGDNRGIGTGTTSLDRVQGDPLRQRIADKVMAAMLASGVIRDGFNFQIGSGAGLLVLAQLVPLMRQRGIRAGFTTGGTMAFHVDLLEQGLLDLYVDGQLFQPDPRIFASLRSDPRHVELGPSWYYDPSSRQPAVDLMDVVVLGASELDLDFNVNTVTGYDGRLRTGIGGGPDAAAGSDLTLFAMPLARVNRAGRSAPCIRERVHTVVTPGEVVSAVITEEAVAINPAAKGEAVERLREGASAAGLQVVTIEQLVELAARRAHELGPLMDGPRSSDEVVFCVEWRDGRLIDCVRRTV